MREGESIKIFCRFLLHHTAENFRRGESFGVSFLYGIEKVWIREEVEFQDVITKTFGLTVPKNLVGEPLSAGFHKIYGCGKAFDKGG